MAQLPPKATTMTQKWHSLPLQMMPINVSAATSQSPSWVDEFINFSPARRNTRRRSETDSIAFLPLLEECPISPPPRTPTVHGENINTGGFERLDDAQLMSMFSDEMEMKAGALVSSSDASTTSDHNSNDDDEKRPPPPPPQDHQKQQQLKEEPWEVDCSCKSNPPTIKPSNTADGNTSVDPKRVKRILANRQSAQRSRVRKLQYISELERSVTTLKTEVSALSPRVAFFHHQRLILNVDNSTLKQRISALAQDKIFKDAREEALRQEIERLRQVFCEQNNKNMAITTPPPTPVSSDDTH